MYIYRYVTTEQSLEVFHVCIQIGELFLKSSSTLQDRAFFPQFGSYLWKTDWIFIKILSNMCL